MVSRQGYGHTWTGQKPKRRRESAHRRAWRLTYGPIPPGLCVLHRCDNRRCVNPTHLFLGTHADNNADMAAKGRAAQGAGHYRAKFSEADIVEIIESAATGRSLAARFGVSESTIAKIRNGRRWKPLTRDHARSRRRGAGHPAARITDADARAIYASGESGATLARRYGISQQSICGIRKGRSWRHATGADT